MVTWLSCYPLFVFSNHVLAQTMHYFSIVVTHCCYFSPYSTSFCPLTLSWLFLSLSARKRMSVIMRTPSGKIRLYCKGAVSVCLSIATRDRSSPSSPKRSSLLIASRSCQEIFSLGDRMKQDHHISHISAK